MVVTKAKRVTTALEKVPKPSCRILQMTLLCIYVYISDKAVEKLPNYVLPDNILMDVCIHLPIHMGQKPWRSCGSRPGGFVCLTKGPNRRPAAVTAIDTYAT